MVLTSSNYAYAMICWSPRDHRSAKARSMGTLVATSWPVTVWRSKMLRFSAPAERKIRLSWIGWGNLGNLGKLKLEKWENPWTPFRVNTLDQHIEKLSFGIHDSLGSFLAPFPVLILRGESWIAWHRMHDVGRRSGVACSMPVRNIVLSCSCRCVGQKHARCILRYFQSSSPITPQEYQHIDISSSTIDSMSMRFEVYVCFPIFGF